MRRTNCAISTGRRGTLLPDYGAGGKKMNNLTLDKIRTEIQTLLRERDRAMCCGREVAGSWWERYQALLLREKELLGKIKHRRTR